LYIDLCFFLAPAQSGSMDGAPLLLEKRRKMDQSAAAADNSVEISLRCGN
jgi:hypothetical protein